MTGGLDARDRLLRHGAETLSDAELLGLLLGEQPAGKLIRGLLKEYGGLSGVAGARSAIQARAAALQNGRTAPLLAAFEIACRLAKARVPKQRLLDRVDSVVSYLLMRYARHDQEIMGALYLNASNRLIGECELYRGSLWRTAVEPRAALKEGLIRGAASFIMFHTHPSGDPAPTDEDLAFSRRMLEAGQVLGIRLLDHMILGAAGQWVSLHRRGWFNN